MPMVTGRRQDASRRWHTRSETHVHSGAVVIIAELSHDLPQMAFAERDDEIETLTPQRSHQSFAVTICLRRTVGCPKDTDSEVSDPAVQLSGEDAVVIVDQISIRTFGQRLA